MYEPAANRDRSSGGRKIHLLKQLRRLALSSNTSVSVLHPILHTRAHHGMQHAY